MNPLTTTEIKKIRGHLLVKGLTTAEIARQFKVSPSAVRQAISGECRSARLQNFVAKKIGYWPWYLKPGERFKRPA